MKKHLFLTIFVSFLMVLLVGCGEVASPTDLRIEEGKLLFSANESANSFLGEFKAESGASQVVNVNSGDLISEFGLALGSYDVRVKAQYSDGKASDWSDAIKVVIDKLSAPKNVRVENNKLYFDNVNGADKYLATFTKEDLIVEKEVISGTLLSNLGLAAGEYNIVVQADLSTVSTNVKSNNSNSVKYTVVLKQLNVPSGLNIEEDYIFFNAMGATDQYVVKFVDGETVIEREIDSAGADVFELAIPAGNYQVSIKAKSIDSQYADSEYSDPISYTKVERIMELKEKDLINAGYIKWMGRTYYDEEEKVNRVYHSASGFELFFKGSEVVATITATNYNSAGYRPCIVIVIDDDFDNATTLFLDKASQDVVLITGNDDALEHKIDLYKRSESLDSHIAISSIRTDGVFMQKIVNKSLKIEFIAASSSTGYGNLGNAASGSKTTSNSDALKGFAFLTAQALDADLSIYSASGWGCAASQWTSPNNLNVPDAYDYVDFSSYQRKAEKEKWAYVKYIPDIVVVNLGTNDWSYINASTNDTQRDERMNAFQKKYIAFLKHLHEIYPDAQLIVLYGLMNEQSIYDVTEQIVENAKMTIPNLLSIKINGDGAGYNSHPSAASHIVIARKLTQFIQENMNLEE